jgi:hypothetical protein
MLKSIAKAVLPTSVLGALRAYSQSKEFRYNKHGLATVHNCDFMIDPKFQRAYAAGISTGSWKESDPQWGAYIACWTAEVGLRLDGDFVECGVNRGGLARTIMEFVDLPSAGKKFYLFDTFEGLLQRYITPEEEASGIKAGDFEPCYDEVVRTFSQFGSSVVLVKGSVPDTLDASAPEKVAYLSIDMNCVQPEIAAAEFFWPRMVSGAIMLLDDYGWARHTAQKQGFDRFAHERGVPILSLPTGQGLIMKP